jgi:hypothetical protein
VLQDPWWRTKSDKNDNTRRTKEAKANKKKEVENEKSHTNGWWKHNTSPADFQILMVDFSISAWFCAARTTC